jgi:hypothetical protein
LLNIDREADSEKARQRADCELDEGFHSFWNATCCHLVFVFVVSVLGAARLDIGAFPIGVRRASRDHRKLRRAS